MTPAALGLELRRSRSLLFWLGLVVVLYAGSMSVFYPVMVENTAFLEEYLELFPEGLLVAFGMTGSLANPGVFFTTYTGSWLWPIVAAIVGGLLGTRAVAADHDRGFLDLALSTPMSRVRWLGTSIVGQIVVIAILSVAMISAVVGVGALVGAEFDAGRFALVIPLAFLFGCAVAAVATLLSVVTLSRGRAAGITAAILLAMYFLNIVAQLEPSLNGLANLSAFHWFDTTAAIDRGELDPVALLLYAGVSVLGWGLALVLFRRRDLAA